MITSLLIEEGHAAYGVYWMVLELLRDCPNYRTNPDPKKLAWSIHASDLALVGRVINNYGLFDLDDDGLLYSPWLVSQMEAYDTKKRKLQEAGRRGAAKRFASSGEREAIATLPSEEREAIAILHNVTQHNVTEHNVTLPSGMDGVDVDDIISNPGPTVSADLIEAMSAAQPEGHAPGYLAQVAVYYGLGENVLTAMLRATNNAEVANPMYKSLCAKIHKIQGEKWRPQMPNNFFMRFISKQK